MQSSIGAVAQALSQVDYGDWSRAHLEAALAGTAELADAEGFVEMRIGGLSGFLGSDPSFAPEFALLSVRSDVDFGASLAAVSSVLGDPPTVGGGSGVFARWPREDVWWTLDSSHVRPPKLDLEPRSVAAERELKDFTWGVIESVPYLWRADDLGGLPPGTNLPGGYLVEGVDDFAPQLTAIAESLAEGVAAFADLAAGVNITVWGPDERYVQWWADAEKASALVDRSWTHFPLNGHRDAVSAVVASIRSWGVEDAEELEHACYAMDRRRRLTMPGIGLSARAG